MTSSTRSEWGVIPGVVYCIVIAVASFTLWGLYKPVSPMMWAFVISIAFANIFTLRESLKTGVGFCSGQLLRIGVAVLGFVTSALIWTRVGVGVLAAFIIIAASLSLSLWLGSRMGLNHRLASLIGVGTAICGASAIAALTPAIKAKEEESGLAVSGITLFGLISMFLYPFLFLNTPVNALLGGSLDAYAIWVGAGVHETAQVIAAAGAVDASVVQAAMLIKSVRIFMIGPVVFLLAWYCSRCEKGVEGRASFAVPLFAVFFTVGSIICAFLDLNIASLLSAGIDWIAIKGYLSSTILPFTFATAFAGVGSKVSFHSILGLGARPILVAAAVAVTAGLLAFLSAVLLVPFIAV
ncbi:MAG: putative sulfate exporter family transporter [Candidatus Bathyarchaeota archaeon]|nr:putative sulfate exporter family transporter [Candidatus Bathyarchaeota archaeon]